MKCDIRIVIITSMLILGFTPTAQAEGYIVQPAYGLVPEPVADTSREVSFYELTPRAMIIFVALSFSPLLVYPVEFFLMMKLFAYLGYRKIDEMVVFHNNNRRVIYETIMSNPGINFNTLMVSYGINRGVLQYHLHILELKKEIIRYHTARTEGYFENSSRWSDLDKCIFLHLRNPTTQKILEIILASPEITRKDITRILNSAGPSVTWHTNRLSKDGIIIITREGRDARIRISREAAETIRRLCPTYPEMKIVEHRQADQPV